MQLKVGVRAGSTPTVESALFLFSCMLTDASRSSSTLAEVYDLCVGRLAGRNRFEMRRPLLENAATLVDILGEVVNGLNAALRVT